MLWLAPARVRAWDPSTLVPVEHWSYALVERLEAAGHLVGTADGIKPYSRRHLARLALRADSVATLTRIDRQRLSLLLRELDPEVRALQSRVAPRPHGLHLQSPAATGPPVQYSADRGGLYVDLLARQQTDVLTGRGRAGSERVYRNRFGGVIRGDLLNDVGFRIAFEQSREQGTGDYDLREDVFERRLEAVQLKGSLADFHAGAAYITFGLGAWVDVQVGKDQVAWGPAPDDNLGLSINAPAFDMIRLRTRLGGLELVSLHGSLATCPERPDSPICGGEADTNASYIVNGMSRLLDRDRWIAAHRVEVAVTPTLDIGFQEVVIYGDRNPEPSYLNPFMFYWAAQSYLGDKDNVMMAIDADWRVRAGLRWWGAYAIDDLKKLKVFSDDFANKFSLQTGILWTDPLGVRDTDLRAAILTPPSVTASGRTAIAGVSLSSDAGRGTCQHRSPSVAAVTATMCCVRTVQSSTSGGICIAAGDQETGATIRISSTATSACAACLRPLSIFACGRACTCRLALRSNGETMCRCHHGMDPPRH